MQQTSEMLRTCRQLALIVGLFVVCSMVWKDVNMAQGELTAESPDPLATSEDDEESIDEQKLTHTEKPQAGNEKAGNSARFGLSQDQIESILRSLWRVDWVHDHSWVVIGDATDEGICPFRIQVMNARDREIGKGVVRFTDEKALKVSLTVTVGGETREVKGFAPTMSGGSPEPDEPHSEVVSRAVREALSQLAEVKPDKHIVYVWAYRKPGAKRWPLKVTVFFASDPIPGYAELDVATLMVLVYPVRMM